jgi:uncharacterized protein
MNIVEEIKTFVESECRKPESKYGYEPFTEHFVPMVGYAEKLADELHGDKEVILISAWLHDIGSIVYGREDHHITGAEIAEKKLTELRYDPIKIELVKKCILNHRGSIGTSGESLEEMIIAEADAMSNFDNLAGIFKAAFVYENLSQKEARESAKQKLERKWNQLKLEKSKEIIRPKYEAVMLLLG